MAQLRVFKPNRWQWLFTLGLSVMLFLVTTPAFATPTAQQDMQRLDSYVEQALAKANAKDLQGAAAAYKQYENGWFDVEDGVKKVSRQAYKDIEGTMGEVKFSFSSTVPSSQSQVVTALQKLHATDQKFTSGGYSTGISQTASTGTSKVTISSLIERLNRAEAAINNNDTVTAATEIKGFQTEWVEVEGIVKTKSKQVYADVENNMQKAYGFLSTSPSDIKGASGAIAQLKQELQPYADANLRYGFLDAALILLREGMEVLLILVALLAFLNKSGHGDQSRWLWIGAGAGILASVAVALIFQIFFTNLAVGTNRELIEGFVGLFAAAMLFYVSYWLHSKSSLGAWQGYIKQQMTSALATNSIFSLSLLAFLAVFREGAETVLFYIGIAPSISTTDLVGGLGFGTIVLGAIAAVMLSGSLQIPLKPFFLLTSLLIYYLGFKFVGSGIHALQVAGILPASTASFLPSWEGVGLYPTWETTGVQLFILIVAVCVVMYERLFRLQQSASD